MVHVLIGREPDRAISQRSPFRGARRGEAKGDCNARCLEIKNFLEDFCWPDFNSVWDLIGAPGAGSLFSSSGSEVLTAFPGHTSISPGKAGDGTGGDLAGCVGTPGTSVAFAPGTFHLCIQGIKIVKALPQSVDTGESSSHEST
jgi:hypothetical protein